MDDLGPLDDRRIAPELPHDQTVHEELGDVADDARVNGLASAHTFLYTRPPGG
ncbi:hypothetical protein QA641_03845 [Bradyrhizobium sp. CB1650]|uniref:hypothetical protein n=1 Tax=Bradyrhizobium sp. CB1650 TaxID=3039153 RepID=UPI0024349272|nr:hypothetical protein [Bradyrhizobium sp. CB1650]WGD53084.1 hypothetical protein QA641_03845 [Bradyrhizobium sp. CB1650]